MYLPKHTRADEAEAERLLANLRAGDLITATAEEGLFATYLPLLHEPGSGGHGRLLGHVARRNDHWRLSPVGESLVIVHGPDAYIAPAWYESRTTTGRVVPTWNYVTAHIYGELVVHDDPDWLEAVVRALTDHHEENRPEPWSVDDAPRPYIDAQLRAIVGVELRISHMEVKAKLGQGGSAADTEGVIRGLRSEGEDAVADAMSRTRPH